MKKEDLIFKTEELEIYKKGSGEIGTFVPLDCLTLIHIAITELSNWENAGLANPDDYNKIVNELCEKLKRTVKYHVD